MRSLRASFGSAMGLLAIASASAQSVECQWESWTLPTETDPKNAAESWRQDIEKTKPLTELQRRTIEQQIEAQYREILKRGKVVSTGPASWTITENGGVHIRHKASYAHDGRVIDFNSVVENDFISTGPIDVHDPGRVDPAHNPMPFGGGPVIPFLLLGVETLPWRSIGTAKEPGYEWPLADPHRRLVRVRAQPVTWEEKVRISRGWATITRYTVAVQAGRETILIEDLGASPPRFGAKGTVLRRTQERSAGVAELFTKGQMIADRRLGADLTVNYPFAGNLPTLAELDDMVRAQRQSPIIGQAMIGGIVVAVLSMSGLTYLLVKRRRGPRVTSQT